MFFYKATRTAVEMLMVKGWMLAINNKSGSHTPLFEKSERVYSMTWNGGRKNLKYKDVLKVIWKTGSRRESATSSNSFKDTGLVSQPTPLLLDPRDVHTATENSSIEAAC